MTPTRINNGDGTQRCTRCETTFPVGHHCICPVGSASPDSSASAAATGMASHSLPDGEVLPTTFHYESRGISVADEMARLRKYTAQLRDDVRNGVIDPDTAAVIAGLVRLEFQGLDMERKAAGDLHRMGRERELPAEVERLESAALKSRERKGRLVGEAEGDDN